MSRSRPILQIWSVIHDHSPGVSTRASTPRPPVPATGILDPVNTLPPPVEIAERIRRLGVYGHKRVRSPLPAPTNNWCKLGQKLLLRTADEPQKRRNTCPVLVSPKTNNITQANWFKRVFTGSNSPHLSTHPHPITAHMEGHHHGTIYRQVTDEVPSSPAVS